MSTRAQIIITDGQDELWFYRHSDGYPEGTMPTLEKFLSWVKEGKIRNNVEQAAGWLVLIGAKEYSTELVSSSAGKSEWKEKENLFEPPEGDRMTGWKCGAYEPCCPEMHGDIEYLYTVDLKKLKITHKEV